VRGALKCIGSDKIDIMIKNDWTILEAIFYGIHYKPDYPEELSEKEIRRLEQMRIGAAKAVLPTLGMAKMIASKFPSEYIEEKLDAGWLMRRADEKFPELAERIRAHGKRGEEWLRKQAREIALFLTGRMVFDPVKGRMIEVGKKEERAIFQRRN